MGQIQYSFWFEHDFGKHDAGNRFICSFCPVWTAQVAWSSFSVNWPVADVHLGGTVLLPFGPDPAGTR